MAVGTGPSQGFFGRMMGQMPGMINAFGQNYGGDLSGAAKGSSALLGRAKKPSMPKGPKVTNGIRGKMPGQQVPLPTIPAMPPPVNGGVNTGPTPEMSIDMPMGGGMGRGMGGFWNPFAPKLDPATGQYGTPTPQLTGPGGNVTPMDGLFGAYNRFRNVRF